MANEKEKANIQDNNQELYELTAVGIYSRAVSIGIVFGYLRNLWREKKLFLPDDPDVREDNGNLIDLSAIFGTEPASVLAYSLSLVLFNAITENKTLDKTIAAQALKNFEDAWAIVRALPSSLPDLADGDSVPNTEKAVCYYFARRPEGTADQWIVHHERPGDSNFSTQTLEEMGLIKSIFSRLTKFYVKSTDNGKKRRSPTMFLDFIREELAVLHSLQEVQNAQEAQKTSKISISAKPVHSLDFPLDKINSNIWNLLTDTQPNGQIAFATEKRGTAKEATILYSINFDQLEPEVSITKKLTPFDKRCYIAIAALFNNNNPVISAAQIYTAMGNKGRPSAKDLQKINDSLTKMAAARVFINNEQEITVNKKYNRFVYDAALLPFERISAIINNQLCESAIHLFREPPLVTFAKDRKQITTISRALLESPLSKTDANLRIDDYLIERIAHIRNGKVNSKLLYTTIFKRCGITEKKQRQRAHDKIRRYLDHYKKCGFIKGYTEAADGITITY